MRTYTRQIGKVLRVMRDGNRRLDIAPRSWLGGVRAVELCPRPDGGWTHVHAVVVSRAWTNYGVSVEQAGGRVAAARAGGLRELLRRKGLGEVVHFSDVRGDSDAVAVYLAKIQHYIGKIDDPNRAGLAWSGRDDLFAAMRGARLVQGFGDLRGLFGGPDINSREGEAGSIQVEARLGRYDPALPGREAPPIVAQSGLAGIDAATACQILGDGAFLSCRETTYVRNTIESWGEWADVPRLLALFAATSRHTEKKEA